MSFKRSGITPIPVRIRWKKKVVPEFLAMPEYVQQFLRQYRRQKEQETYVLGFSFGAMIALIAAARVKPSTLILCSLSPFFKEDLPRLPKLQQRHFQKIKPSATIYSFRGLAERITARTRTVIVVGGKEPPEVLRKAREAKRKLSRSRLLIIRDAKHRIAQAQYLASLHKLIVSLV